MSASVLPVQNERTSGSAFPLHNLPVRADQNGDIGMARATLLPLSSNNPFNSASEPVSPISPVEQQQIQPLVAPKPYRPANADKSAGLRGLEGSSYENSNTARRVKVAQDMYNGQNPPDYESPTTQTVAVPSQEVFVRSSEQHTSCRSCGRRRTSANGEANSSSQELVDDCTKCGKRKASMSIDSGRTFPASGGRAVSDSIVTTMGPPASMPSGSRTAASARPCCQKCGRKQRPGQISTSPSSPTAAAGNDNVASSLTSHSPQAQPLQKSTSFGIEPIRPTHKALPRLQSSAFVEIDITPPTASTYRPVNSPFPDDSPLLDGRAKKAPKPSRSASIASAISRTFSRRKSRKGSSATSPVSSSENPLPSQQLKHDAEHSPSKLINMINHAIHGNESQDYARLGAGELKIDRPDSPFSFADKPAEDEAFEMNDMRISKLTIDPDLDFLKGPYSAPLLKETSVPLEPVRRPEHLRSKSEAITSTLAVPSKDDMYLADPNQRPTITRFKSLRVGVERAASVTRSTSLRRLNSIKKTPELWYRTDMALEGAIGAY